MVIALAGLDERLSDVSLITGYASLVPMIAAIVALAVVPWKRTLLIAAGITLFSAFCSEPWLAVIKVVSDDPDVMFYTEKFATLGRLWIGCFVAALAVMAVLFGVRRVYTHRH